MHPLSQLKALIFLRVSICHAHFICRLVSILEVEDQALIYWVTSRRVYKLHGKLP